MKNFYYFSSRKLKFVEIKYFNIKLISAITALSLVLSLVGLGAYIKFTKRTDIEFLKNENEKLVAGLNQMLDKYDNLKDKAELIADAGNSLRLSVNLQSLSEEDRQIGIGGKAFNELIPLSSVESVGIVEKLSTRYDNLLAKVNFQKIIIKEIEDKIAEDKTANRFIPALKPVDASLGDDFGMRFHPIKKVRTMHHGQDFRCNTGAKVYAPADGKVSFAGRRGGYGRTIEIDHGNGYKTLFGHLYRFKVNKGDIIKRGDLIALSGNSGSLSTGPHLHYEVKYNGVTQNPVDYFYDDLAPETYNAMIAKK